MPARLEHDHDVVGVLEGLAPVGGRGDRGVDAVVVDHALDEGVHFVQARVRQGHEPVLAAGERRELPENRTSGFCRKPGCRRRSLRFCHR